MPTKSVTLDTHWGVELPDGEVVLAEDQEDAAAIVQAVKVVNPRAKWRMVNRTVRTTTTYSEWHDVA